MAPKINNPHHQPSFGLKFYEGYKHKERPAAIVIGDKEIKIKKSSGKNASGIIPAALSEKFFSAKPRMAVLN
ncbi:MAG: hypothetical protein J7L26_06970 [Candidatus Aminicenantes bacterium]|nr:hypothetical protein [Candidatus Aminicenantes bacterium]